MQSELDVSNFCRRSCGNKNQSARDAHPRAIYRKVSLECRKRIIARPLHSPPAEQGWLDLESTPSVDVTSEDSAFPIESALLPPGKGGWRATEPCVQMIRLIFNKPQRVRRITVFEETKTKRSQEFSLRWSPDRGSSFQLPYGSPPDETAILRTPCHLSVLPHRNHCPVTDGIHHRCPKDLSAL